MNWSYGVTTVPARRGDLLPRTLASLAAAGWPKPHLFVDGDADGASWAREFGVGVTARAPAVGIAGSWCLALLGLYAADPWADRYFVVQDDCVLVKNLRAYLEACPYRPKTYWNLFTLDKNQTPVPNRAGWFESHQRGMGAVALVFDRETVVTLLSSRHMAARFQNRERGHRAVDGGIVEALGQAGWRELVHAPQLAQHTGAVSTICKQKHATRDSPPDAYRWPEWSFASSFPGEGFDALDLLGCK